MKITLKETMLEMTIKNIKLERYNEKEAYAMMNEKLYKGEYKSFCLFYCDDLYKENKEEINKIIKKYKGNNKAINYYVEIEMEGWVAFEEIIKRNKENQKKIINEVKKRGYIK